MRTGSASVVAVACHASRRPESAASSSWSAVTDPSGETSAAIHASTGPPVCGRRRRSAGSRSAANRRASESVQPHMKSRRASQGATCSGSEPAGSRPPASPPSARNTEGSDHASLSIRPRSAPSTSGRHRARHPAAVSSSDGRTRPRVVSSRTISTARAANRKSAASATPLASPAAAPTVSPAADTSVDSMPAQSVHSTTRPGTVHARGSVASGASSGGSAPCSSSHGEAVGPSPVPGSRSSSSISSGPSGSPNVVSASLPTARRMPPASSAKGWGRGRGRRGGRPRRAGALRGSRSSSAHRARRPADATQAAWRTSTQASCTAGVPLSRCPRSGQGARTTTVGPPIRSAAVTRDSEAAPTPDVSEDDSFSTCR